MLHVGSISTGPDIRAAAHAQILVGIYAALGVSIERIGPIELYRNGSAGGKNHSGWELGFVAEDDAALADAF